MELRSLFPEDTFQHEEILHDCSITHGSSTLRLHCGDSLQHLDTLPDGSIDLVVTSPPYNIGLSYNEYDDTQSREEYLHWVSQWVKKIERVLAPEGSFFLNISGKPTDHWVPFQVAATVVGATQIDAVHRPGAWTLQNTFHWIKSISIDPECIGGKNISLTEPLSVGHYKPINSPRFVNDVHEYVFHFTKSGKVPVDRLALGVPYQDKSNIARWKGGGKSGEQKGAERRDVRCRGNNWFIPYDTINSRKTDRPHPATFPVSLPKWAIQLHGQAKVKTVLDPFMGIGSSAIACLELEVGFIGIELDALYYRDAVQRIRSHIYASSNR